MFRLLIADDEVIERAVLYKTLSRNLKDLCEIYQAENGREALRIYEEKQIQIAILDIEMPGINGIEAARRIREQDKNCCIIFLTAYDEFAYARQAIMVRALDYLLKPYDEQELMLVVEEAMHITEESQKEAAARAEWQAAHGQAAGESGQESGKTEKEAGEARQKAGSGGKAPGGYEAESGISREKASDRSGPGEGEETEDPGNVRLAKVMELILQYIRQNYMYDISMQDAAKEMNYSEAYFCKLFKQCFQKNFTSYLTEYRVEEAKKLLGQPTVNIKEIGKAVGYGDSNYFAKVFKRITGRSPSEYRLEMFQKE